MEKSPDDPVTRYEFEELEKRVSIMSDNIDKFAKYTSDYMKKIDMYQGSMINALTNTTPSGHIPIESHKQVVRGIIVSFSIILVVAIGATKVAPLLGLFN